MSKTQMSISKYLFFVISLPIDREAKFEKALI